VLLMGMSLVFLEYRIIWLAQIVELVQLLYCLELQKGFTQNIGKQCKSGSFYKSGTSYQVKY
jgi:hypothetical protein